MEPAAAPTSYLHIATFLPVRRWRSVPSFLMLSNRVRAQARSSPGLVAEAVSAHFPRRWFYTYTIWRDRATMRAFLNQGPHGEALQRFNDWRASGASNVEWESDDPTIDWTGAMRRLETPSYRFPD